MKRLNEKMLIERQDDLLKDLVDVYILPLNNRKWVSKLCELLYFDEPFDRRGKVFKEAKFFVTCMIGFSIIKGWNGRWVKTKHGLSVQCLKYPFTIHISKMVNASQNHKLLLWIDKLNKTLNDYSKHGYGFKKEDLECLTWH
jgi:hypothetical protein